MLYQDFKSPNFDKDRRAVPDVFVIHQTNGSFPCVRDWFLNPDSLVSAHYVIDRCGRLYRFVDPRCVAWANGASLKGKDDDRSIAWSTSKLVRSRRINPNRYTISIEFETRPGSWFSEILPGQYLAGASLLLALHSWVINEYGVSVPLDDMHVLKHCEISPKHKPCCGAAINKARLFHTIEVLRQDAENNSK